MIIKADPFKIRIYLLAKITLLILTAAAGLYFESTHGTKTSLFVHGILYLILVSTAYVYGSSRQRTPLLILNEDNLIIENTLIEQEDINLPRTYLKNKKLTVYRKSQPKKPVYANLSLLKAADFNKIHDFIWTPKDKL